MMPVGIDDKYEVVKTIQETATTAVILVRHKQLNELRILKSISVDDPRAQFILSEANLLSGLRSPELPTIYDVGQLNNANYLVEEYFEGQPLNDYLCNQKEISLLTFFEISIQICELFEILHFDLDNPVIYLDLKPEHVIFTEQGLKLIDFGIAQKGNNNGEFKGYGTRGYASPEQLEGNEIDVRSDIYSIGMIMKYMLNYIKDTENQDIQAILKKVTAHSREARPNSVKELKDMLAVEKENCKNISKEEKHLQRKIAVVSSEKGVGTTTIAIALVAFLNSKGIRSYYMDKSEGRVLQKLKRSMPELKRKDGVLYHNNFYGYQEYGPAVDKISPPKGWRVVDYGSQKGEKPENTDLIFYICSGSPWQQDERIPKWLQDEDCIIIMNHYTRASAVNYSREIHKKVYGYPYKDAYFGSKETNRLFEKILANEVTCERSKKKVQRTGI